MSFRLKQYVERNFDELAIAATMAKVLAERFVIDRRWSEERAVAFGTEVLRDNTTRIFGDV